MRSCVRRSIAKRIIPHRLEKSGDVGQFLLPLGWRVSKQFNDCPKIVLEDRIARLRRDDVMHGSANPVVDWTGVDIEGWLRFLGQISLRDKWICLGG